MREGIKMGVNHRGSLAHGMYIERRLRHDRTGQDGTGSKHATRTKEEEEEEEAGPQSIY